MIYVSTVLAVILMLLKLLKVVPLHDKLAKCMTAVHTHREVHRCLEPGAFMSYVPVASPHGELLHAGR